jgi:hypothetical protein
MESAARTRWAHTRDWHYINIGDDEPLDALVEGQVGRGQLLGAIRANLAVLADELDSPPRRREALSFVIHLVADLHQPLHVGRSEDRGGNTITVRFDGEETNLHRLWDGGLLRSAGLRQDDYRRTSRRWSRSARRPGRAARSKTGPRSRGACGRGSTISTRAAACPLISKRYAETGRQLTALRLAQAWLLNARPGCSMGFGVNSHGYT